MGIQEAIRRNWRYIVFFTVTLVLLWVLYTWRMVLLPFLVGVVLAYLMMPLVKWIERILPGKTKHTQKRRLLSIIILIVTIMFILAFVAFIAVNIILHYSSQLLADSGKYITQIIAKAQEWTTGLRNIVPESARSFVDKVVADIAGSITSTLQGSGSGGSSKILSSLGIIFGFAATPLFLFYMLKDSDLVVNGVCSTFGKRGEPHLRQILCVIESVLGRYVKAEFILSAVLFALTFAGLTIIGIPLAFSLPLAFIYGLGELIPTLGAWIAGAIMILVTLAVAPQKILWVILLDLIAKLSENMLLVPRIQASTMRMHPALVIMLLVIGGHFWGLWGMMLTVPIVSTLKDVFKYLRTTDPAQQALAASPAQATVAAPAPVEKAG
jgi:predicted PurR-regulated permease PerM